MSAIVRRDRNGVILRYEIDLPLPAQSKSQPSDRQRMAVLKAEREIVTLDIILQHVDDLSDIARTRVSDALTVIYRALELERREII